MQILKKVIAITILSAIFVITGNSKSVFAAETSYTNTNVIDLKNLDSSSNVTVSVSDVLSYDEMANIMANDQNISLDGAKKILGDDCTVKVNSKMSNSLVTPLSIGYRTVAVKFAVGWPEYRPLLTFYIKTEEGGSLGWGIVSVLNMMLMTYDERGYYRSFQGEIFYHLESITSIYYSINGAFYHSGTTTYENGYEIKVGEFLNIVAKTTDSNNLFAPISQYGRFSQYR